MIDQFNPTVDWDEVEKRIEESYQGYRLKVLQMIGELELRGIINPSNCYSLTDTCLREWFLRDENYKKIN